MFRALFVSWSVILRLLPAPDKFRFLGTKSGVKLSIENVLIETWTSVASLLSLYTQDDTRFQSFYNVLAFPK